MAESARLQVVVDRQALLRRLGRTQAAISQRMSRALETVEWEASARARPGCVYRALGRRAYEDRSFLAPAEGIILCAVTIGSALELRVHELQRRGEIAHALLLDAWGSTAVEAAADAAERRIAREVARRRRLRCSRRFSPGYGGWEVEEQAWVLETLGGPATGLRLTPGGMLVPRKSTTFAVCVGEHPLELRCTGRCEDCDVPHCRFRQEGPSPEEGRGSWVRPGGLGSGC